MKFVAVLYPGPTEEHSDRSRLPMLGSASQELDLRPVLERLGHELVSLTDQGDELRRHLQDADVLITTPFWPAYISREDVESARKLSLIVTAGVGSDHIDTDAAAERGITVAEVTGSNVVSVAEHAVMQLLVLVRTFVPAYRQVIDGHWNIADIAAGAHDLEGKTVGIVGMGQIGQRIALRLQAFDVQVLYNNRSRRTAAEEAVFGSRYKQLDDLIAQSDAVIVSCPLTAETKGLFGPERLNAMRPGSWMVNIARAQIVDRDALVAALESGQLAGYAGDVWYPQPAGADHPWRMMPNHAMTPHAQHSKRSSVMPPASATSSTDSSMGNLHGATTLSRRENRPDEPTHSVERQMPGQESDACRKRTRIEISVGLRQLTGRGGRTRAGASVLA